MLLLFAGAYSQATSAQVAVAGLGGSAPAIASGNAASVYASSIGVVNGLPATAQKPTLPLVRVNVVVTPGRDSGPATAYHVAARDILSSAGTYGDFSRYLQIFPGVTFNSDESDDVLVRGGNPIENLYRIDGFDIPNINHLATQGTTGGLVSMVDTSAIENLDFLTGGYDASYDERLSSVIDIHTKESLAGHRDTQADLGFVGAGVTIDGPLFKDGSLLVSVHRSLLNLFTNDIGLNGVPIYTNALVHAHLAVTPSDSVSFLTVAGADSINIKPECTDVAETSTIDTQYRGWRVTAGLHWQHLFSPVSFGIVTISDSEDKENIHQEDQLFDGGMPVTADPVTFPAVPVYSELTHDGVTGLRLDYHTVVRKRLVLLAGTDARVHRVMYDVDQPEGEFSPLNADPSRTDATSFAPHFSSGESGTYAQAAYQLSTRWALGAGLRFQTFALGSHETLTPRLTGSYRVSNHLDAHFSFGEYAQLPPYIYLTAFPQNRKLAPMRDRQIVTGFDLYSGSLGTVKIEGFRKDYRDYPVSSEYPTLSLANMVDTLGQEFIWIPMVSAGGGRAAGIELSGETHFRSHLSFMGNVALARDKFSGLDGVPRPGNFDYPFVANAAGTYRSGRRYEVSYRYEYSTGRPYTPFLLGVCAAQNRPVYDMSQVNALRGPAYSRLDFSVTRNFFLGERILSIYGGLENALDRQNFLGYAWTPRVDIYSPCGANPANCVAEETQMGLFPNFGARFHF
jgi:hypothetical protein